MLYKANAALFINGEKYLVCLRKKDERNLDVNAAGAYGQRFRLQGNCVSPKFFPLSVETPIRGNIVLDPVDINTVTAGGAGNIIGDFILDEDHRTRWKAVECCLGQRFEGYVIPRRNTDGILDGGSGNVQEPNNDPWT